LALLGAPFQRLKNRLITLIFFSGASFLEPQAPLIKISGAFELGRRAVVFLLKVLREAARALSPSAMDK
jgi:hypothetical protein